MPYQQMVALGSSFAAGPGVAPVVNRAAMRSGRNYNHLVAVRLGATLVDATVSGATTSTILQHRQRAGLRSFPPQIESVPADADLVTVTAGGNDLGYLGGILLTALVGQLTRWRVTGPLGSGVQGRRVLRPMAQEQLDAATAGLAEIVEQVRQRAPRARVVLVDYLPVFTDASTTGPDVPLSAREMDHFRSVADQLSTAYRDAASGTGADLVPASTYDQGYGAGSAEPWLHGLRLGTSMASSFHPTAAGMQAVADAVVDHLVSAGNGT